MHRFARALVLVASLLAACARPVEPVGPVVCSGGPLVEDTPIAQLARDLEREIPSNALYRELVSRAGPALGCVRSIEGERVELSYAFRGDFAFEAVVDPRIELSEMSATGPDFARDAAIRALREFERDAYTPDGCGIDWDAPPEGSGDAGSAGRADAFRGDTCNCQARIVYEGTRIRALIFRSTC